MIDAVAPRDRAQPRQVQVGVLDLQRIEGPFQQLNPLLDGVFPLRELQPPSQAMVAKRVAYSEHVRMQVSMPGPAAGNGKGKAHQLVALESSNGLATDFLADHEHAQRDQVHVIKIPDLFLQGDTGFEFFHASTFADGNLISPRYGSTQSFGSSRDFACCHNASISSRVACSSVRPCSRNLSSSQPKRRRNFRLVLRRADSGST